MKAASWIGITACAAVISMAAPASAAPFADEIPAEELPRRVMASIGLGDDASHLPIVVTEEETDGTRVSYLELIERSSGDAQRVVRFTERGGALPDVSDDASKVVALGPGGVRMTTVGGNTWRTVSLSRTGNALKRSSYDAHIAGNGPWVAFESKAANVVWKDKNGTGPDLFITNTNTGKNLLVSVGPMGKQASYENDGSRPTLAFQDISDSGRYVLFTVRGAPSAFPGPGNLTRAFLWDRATRTTTWLHDETFQPNGSGGRISGDGSTVIFPARLNVDESGFSATVDLVTYSTTTGDYTNLTSEIRDDPANETHPVVFFLHPQISDDATTISYWFHRCTEDIDDPKCENLFFLHDITTGDRREVSQDIYSISGDGNYALGVGFWTKTVLFGPLHEEGGTS